LSRAFAGGRALQAVCAVAVQRLLALAAWLLPAVGVCGSSFFACQAVLVVFGVVYHRM